MSTVAKGSSRKAHRQPGRADKSIPSKASSDPAPKSSVSSRKGPPGNPQNPGASKTISSHVEGSGPNAGPIGKA